MLLCSGLHHLERLFLPGKHAAAGRWELCVSRGCAGLSMSFIQVDKDSDFPLQNLPYGVFSTKEEVSNSKLCYWAVVIVPGL